MCCLITGHKYSITPSGEIDISNKESLKFSKMFNVLEYLPKGLAISIKDRVISLSWLTNKVRGGLQYGYASDNLYFTTLKIKVDFNLATDIGQASVSYGLTKLKEFEVSKQDVWDIITSAETVKRIHRKMQLQLTQSNTQGVLLKRTLFCMTSKYVSDSGELAFGDYVYVNSKYDGVVLTGLNKSLMQDYKGLVGYDLDQWVSDNLDTWIDEQFHSMR